MQIKVLCVDDEKMVIDTLRSQFADAFGRSARCHIAESAEEAIDLLKNSGTEGYDLVIADWLMPKMKGDELLEHVHTLFPKACKILLTGQANPQTITDAKSRGVINHVVMKPWQKDELLDMIHACVKEP